MNRVKRLLVLAWFPVLLFGLAALIGVGLSVQHTRSSAIHADCTPTEFYVIGDKGHVNRVFKCDE